MRLQATYIRYKHSTNDLDMLNALYNVWNASIFDIAAVAGLSWSIGIQPINSAVTSNGAQKGG